MSGGGKGKSQETTSTVELPKHLEEASKSLIDRADFASRIGFQPNRSVDVAGFTPMQQQAFQNQANMGSAFGMGTPGATGMEGMPKTEVDPYTGMSGYRSANQYDSAMAGLPTAYKDYINSGFINPNTGEMGMGGDLGSWRSGGEGAGTGKGGLRENSPYSNTAQNRYNNAGPAIRQSVDQNPEDWRLIDGLMQGSGMFSKGGNR